MAHVPDFWGFLQQCEAKLNEESIKVTSDAEMKDLVARWLDPKHGMLQRMKDDPMYSLAKLSAQQIFMETMRNRVYQVEREWQQVWRSLHEPGA